MNMQSDDLKKNKTNMMQVKKKQHWPKKMDEKC